MCTTPVSVACCAVPPAVLRCGRQFCRKEHAHNLCCLLCCDRQRCMHLLGLFTVCASNPSTIHASPVLQTHLSVEILIISDQLLLSSPPVLQTPPRSSSSRKHLRQHLDYFQPCCSAFATCAADSTPLLIFPEGTCVNNEYVVMFKRGAFDLGESLLQCRLVACF